MTRGATEPKRDERKTRKVGVRLRMAKADPAGGSMVHPAYGAIEVYDVESGEIFEGVGYAGIHYDVSGVIAMTMEVFVAEITTLDTPPHEMPAEFTLEAQVRAEDRLMHQKASTLISMRRRRLSGGA